MTQTTSFNKCHTPRAPLCRRQGYASLRHGETQPSAVVQRGSGQIGTRRLPGAHAVVIPAHVLTGAKNEFNLDPEVTLTLIKALGVCPALTFRCAPDGPPPGATRLGIDMETWADDTGGSDCEMKRERHRTIQHYEGEEDMRCPAG
jgi:hypothetical protein